MAIRGIFYTRSKRHRTDYVTPYHPTSTGSNVHDIHHQTLPPSSHHNDEQSARKPRQQRRETLRDIGNPVFTFRVESPDGDDGGRQSTAAKARRFARFSNPTLDPPMVCKFQAIVAKDDREGLEDSTTELEPFVPEESLSPTFPYQTLKDDDAPKDS
ncbi:hypothetical protein FRB93_011753 [Tulasnella sp. JGI-2019a]|nr:hypothetical protein FRB93_011753 [Tulasnella sp. JGI-2019a]